MEYLQDGNVLLDYIDADLIIPISHNNSYINEVVAISRSQHQDNGKDIWISLLTVHSFNGSVYRKEHKLYRSKSIDKLGEEIDLDSYYPNLDPTIEYKTTTPHFQIYRPMGISIFANRIDNLKALDMKYDCFYNEFQMGRKRVLIDRHAVKKSVDTATGQDVQFFDTEDAVFMAINGMENQPIKEIDFSIRAEEHINAINIELNYLSAGVGLGQDF